MVEYIDQNIHTLSWQIGGGLSGDLTEAKYCGDTLIGGSDTALTIWQFHDKSQIIQDQLPIVECGREIIPSKAARVYLIGDRAFVALSNGTVQVHDVVTEKTGVKSFKLVSEAKNLHNSYRCNDMVFCPQSNSVITCGNDGGLAMFNVDRPQKATHFPNLDASLKCIDLVNPNEVICGDLNGCLRHYDVRSGDYVSFTNQSFSSLLCVQRNPNVNHLAIGGNDQGSIILYDLRNESSAVAEISAHSAAVTNIKYRPRDPNIIYSSSIDGDLFRWSLNNQFLVNHIPKKVESIGDTSDPISITAFDVNDTGDIIYTTDHGAIFYRKLNESGP